MQHNIATIINFCSNDYRFLNECINRVRAFSKQILIPVCDHFFDGREESREILHRAYFEHPDCTFIEFAFGKPYGMNPHVPHEDAWTHYWHSTSRYVGYHFLNDVEYVLFLDADEICDTRRFVDWLECSPYREFSASRFPGYFYFLRPEYQCQVHFGSMLFARKESLGGEMLLSIEERKGTFHAMGGRKQEGVYALDNKPLFHHYSWVRSKSELQRKVASWGHKADDNWPEKLARLEAEPFTGVGPDPVHGLPYDYVAPFCDPLEINVDLLRTREIHRKCDVRGYPNVIQTDPIRLLAKTC